MNGLDDRIKFMVKAYSPKIIFEAYKLAINFETWNKLIGNHLETWTKCLGYKLVPPIPRAIGENGGSYERFGNIG
jgi:hypothetical protein